MAARLVGVEPSSPCVQLECLANLLRNRVNSQRHPNLYEVWRQKIAEDIKKQTVRRLCWDGKVPGICVGTKAAMAPSREPDAGYKELDHQLPPLPEQGGKPSTRRDLDAGSHWGKWR